MTLVEPEMRHIIKLVVPKIMNEWEYIAFALQYDLAAVQAIKQKGHDNPKKCCVEFFKDWLMTSNGAKAGPKVWSTLISALEEIDEISTDITEEIAANIEEGTHTIITLKFTIAMVCT